MIRPALPSDQDAIGAFDPFFGDRGREIVEGRMLVAEVGGAVAGFCTFSVDGFIGRPFVHFLAVAPSYRRRGVALALLRDVTRRIAAGRIFISTESHNTTMHAVLARDGWTFAGAVAAVNFDESPEWFYFKNLPDASSTTVAGRME
jgi:ribosomal protein S18 acetylase RimI-like enzyme